MPKYTVKVYRIERMSEVEVDSPSEGKALEMAEEMARVGKLKFWKPDKPFALAIFKEAKKKSKATPGGASARSEGELLEGGQDDGS